VVQFSGGIGSWAAAQRVAAEHGTDNLVLLFADTLIEDPDLYRFLCEAASQIGVLVTRVADGRTPFEVFWQQRFLGNSRIAPCSEFLKQRPSRRWLEAHTDPADTVLHVGIDWSEQRRPPAIERGWAPWTATFPMCNPPYPSGRS
jgi:3'-phosphoadenosine 5'-phosphosulfate sulfotransferase (PAPS reductase)/FAD synthetase